MNEGHDANNNINGVTCEQAHVKMTFFFKSL